MGTTRVAAIGVSVRRLVEDRRADIVEAAEAMVSVRSADLEWQSPYFEVVSMKD